MRVYRFLVNHPNLSPQQIGRYRICTLEQYALVQSFIFEREVTLQSFLSRIPSIPRMMWQYFFGDLQLNQKNPYADTLELTAIVAAMLGATRFLVVIHKLSASFFLLNFLLPFLLLLFRHLFFSA